MAKFLIIPDYNNLNESLALANKYSLGFEYNDFFTPAMLDNEPELNKRINTYNTAGVPEYCTSHGDFFDVLVFSDDPLIREISKKRVYQSMDVAKKLNVKGVVFHTNHTSFITTKMYCDNFINRNCDFWTKVCSEYPDINVYIENMFDTNPSLLARLAESMKSVKNFGVCLDYAHATAFGTDDISNWIEQLFPYIKHLHINDNDLKDDLHLAVGDGQINWQEFKTYYEKYFTDCSILIEVTGIEKQRKSIEYLASIGILN